jgi:peroxiredoxin (alkyl hydroperoxide reductase subunit C)
MAVTKGRNSKADRTSTVRAGDTAPGIALTTHTNGKFDLAELRGKKNVVLAFYPFAFTGV